MEKMDKLTMCRICLVENVRMHAVTDMQLQETFERLIGIPFVTGDSRPVLACFFCYARLKQCSHFMMKCREAEQVFTQILNGDYEPKPLNSRQYCGGLIRTLIENIDIVDVEQNLVVVKEELLANTAGEEVKEGADIDGTLVEEKPTLKILKEKLKDVISNKRDENEQTNLKDIDKIVKYESTSKLEQPSISNLTTLKANNSIVLKEAKTSKKTEVFTNNCNDLNIDDKTKSDTFKTSSIQRAPLNIKKNNAVNLFECDICHKSFDKKGKFNKHIRTHTSEKSFKCIICQSSFLRKYHLDMHILKHTGEKPNKCDICHRSFIQKAHLKSHMRTHTGERPYKCDICLNSFAQKSNLHKHMLTHTGEKPHKCDICHSSFTVKGTLLKHIRTHTGERPYKCVICHSSFTQKTHLIIHIRTHTREKPYKCDICPSRFPEKSSLYKHMRTHTGERPFKCDVCVSSFSQKSNLYKHIRTHTGERPYKCDTCHSTFTQKSSLDKHIRTQSHAVERT